MIKLYSILDYVAFDNKVPRAIESSVCSQVEVPHTNV